MWFCVSSLQQPRNPGGDHIQPYTLPEWERRLFGSMTNNLSLIVLSTWLLCFTFLVNINCLLFREALVHSKTISTFSGCLPKSNLSCPCPQPISSQNLNCEWEIMCKLPTKPSLWAVVVFEDPVMSALCQIRSCFSSLIKCNLSN